MPGLGRYPCSTCHYVANNRRMLARHAVLIHNVKSFKCPLCPFITRYAANWYRHKRDQHGLTKLTTCEVCGFFASSTDELAEHKESEHLNLLELPKYEDKYAKEKLRLVAESDAELSPCDVAANICETILEEDVDVELQEPNLINGKLTESEDFNSSGELSTIDDSITFSLPLNGGLLDSDYSEVKTNSTEASYPESGVISINSTNTETSTKLKPLRIRRSYCCDQCGLLTSDPREYLYHCRDVHGERISVHECKYCIYASKHVQKLQRHCNLVHPQQVAKEKELKKQQEAEENELRKQREAEENELRKQREAEENELKKQLEAQEKELKKQREAQESELRKQLEADKAHRVPVEKSSNFTQIINRRNTIIFKCKACSYQTRNKVFMTHHEKTVHLKKKIYRCIKCGYTTNEKSRYAKHIKYHNLPKIQCEFCFFKTAYKWNMDRHMKNHIPGVEGAYCCTLCNFTTGSKQSLTAHVNNHHDLTLGGNLIQQDMMDFNDKDSFSESQWEDINVFDEEDMMFEDNDPSASAEEFAKIENSGNNWNQQQRVSKKTLKCQTCDFKATWPFELRKHEENHRSTKKHQCPLCGMRFEHIAWLTKHLGRIHKENSQAKNIADAFERMKPTRKRPAKDSIQNADILPMFQEVLKQTNVTISKPQNSLKPPSMLSTLLKKPLPTPLNKFTLSKQRQSASLARQPQISNYLVSPKPILTQASKLKKVVPTCNVCGYKTRWSSELERHMRVHTQEKPFQCSKCKYHCKWKGDLNRHLMKYHGIKVPPASKKNTIPKLKLKKASSNQFYSDDDWETVNQEMNHSASSTSGADLNDQDSPLDLRLSKSTFPHPYLTKDAYKIYDFESNSLVNSEADAFQMQFSGLNESNSPRRASLSSHPKEETEDMLSTCKKKYQCPFCIFSTTTASRFHVHIVQHYNKRPFMCSLCSYRSNWEWDITKHIRLKGCKDKAHNKACVLLTDETGRRNYDKYEKYLVDIDQPSTSSKTKSLGTGRDHDFDTRYQKRNSENASKKNCTYDFKNIASNFESDPVNIVVTPDINFSGETNNLEKQLNSSLYARDFNVQEFNTGEKSDDYKYYYCKHCNYKHSTKRVVVSHLSVHAGLKPFRCNACGVTSNWRHVIVRHVKDIHNGNMSNVEDRIMFTQEGYGIRLTSVNTNTKEASIAVQRSSARFGCKVCPYTCDKEYYIKFHMKQHKPHDGAIYQCTFCPYFVKFKKTLAKHIKLHNAYPSNKIFSENLHSQENINDYRDISLENNSFGYDPQFDEMTEDSIAISFNKLQSSTEDQTSTPKFKRHICKHCPYKTDNKTQYLYHKQFHRPNSSAPFKCSACSYWATMQHLLTQHMKVHYESDTNSVNTSFETDSFEDPFTEIPEQISVVYVKREGLVVKMFKCDHCPMMNKKKANVRVHQKMHGVIVKNGKFACSFCDYQCLNQGGLTNHIKIHRKSGGKETFLNRSDANLNINTHMVSKEQESANVSMLKKCAFSYFCLKCPALFKSSSDYNIHSKFHGSNLPLPCPHCDYRARNKTHLSKHSLVHTPEYILKRSSSQGPPVSSEHNNVTEFTDSASLKNFIGPRKKIDQMLLLEASEVKASFKMSQDSTNKLHTCVFCPASFIKTSTLAYHISLHGSGGEFKCSHCDYSTTRSDNLDIHSQVHPETAVKKVTLKRNIRTFSCPKCPAVFYKQDRYNRHFDLHGKNYRFVCGQCDYSVRFVANLNKHKKVHANTIVPQNSVSSPIGTNEPNNLTVPQDVAIDTSLPSYKPQNETLEQDDKKIYYICDRCPYAQARKDAVQSHQRRHWLQDGIQCPYCDYSSMNSAKLREHVKIHIQETQLFPAQAFMKYEKFEIWYKDDGDDILLFEDKFLEKSLKSDDISNGENEFEKSLSLSKKVGNIPLETSKAFSKMNETRCMNRNSKTVPVKSKSNSSPVVVLSDIFANDRDLKRWVPEGSVSSLRKKLKIKNLLSLPSISNDGHLKKSAANGLVNIEDKSHERLNKPNIVVKIKVENCLKDNCEKTTYSVTTKNTEDAVQDVTVADNESENSLENTQSESQISNDFPECFMYEDTDKLKEDVILNIESKIDVVDKQIDCDKIVKKPTTCENEIPVHIVTDILPECTETFKLEKNINCVTNGDITHLSNKISVLSDDVEVSI